MNHLRLLTLFFLCLQQFSCAARKFAEPGAGNLNADSLLTITCQAEKDQQPIELKRAAQDYFFSLEPICVRTYFDAGRDYGYRPVNILYLIDITGSMQETIDAVKNSLVQFAAHLHKNYWDARFGVIGFKDQLANFKISSKFYENVHDLENLLKDWRAEGGGNYPEGGLTALEQGMRLLLEEQKKFPARKAHNIILYISDAVAHRGDEAVLDVAATRQVLLEGEALLAGTKYYIAVPDASDPDLSEEEQEKLPTPCEQMHELFDLLPVYREFMNYPLTPAILQKYFAERFVDVMGAEQLSCRADSARLSSQIAAGVLSYDEVTGLAEKLAKSPQVTFNVSHDPDIQSYTLAVSRCCNLVDAPDAGCRRREENIVPLGFVGRPAPPAGAP